jgi:hypothetical protein
MPQTILALLALMVAMLFSLQMQKRALQTQQRMIRDDLAIHSTGFADEMLGLVGTQAFDEAVKGSQTVDARSELTAGPPFNDGGSNNDDIDDFHDAFANNDLTRRVNGADLTFDIDVDVEYVENDDTDGSRATRRTKTKRVTVKVTSLDVPNAQTIELSRPFTCGGGCDF